MFRPKPPLVFLGFGCPMTEMGALVREKLAGAQKSLFSPWNKGCMVSSNVAGG